MAILFFDTETTGLIRDDLPLDHADQPHIVQIAGDFRRENGEEISSFSLIVNPSVPIPPKLTEIHGIDDATASTLGVSELAAVKLFMFLYARADVVVAHNAKFDTEVIRVALARFLPDVLLAREEDGDRCLVCTMEASRALVNIPPTEKMLRAGRTEPKAPKLAECMKHFFNDDHLDAHDAMADLKACRRIYFHLKSIGAIP